MCIVVGIVFKRLRNFIPLIGIHFEEDGLSLDFLPKIPFLC